MKKNLKLALQTTGFLALFSLALTSINLQAADTSSDKKADTSVSKSSDNDRDRENRRNRRHDRDGQDNDDDDDDKDSRRHFSEEQRARFRKKLAAELEEWQTNSASLETAYNKAKDAPVKTLAEIQALTDDEARRLETFRYIKSASKDKPLSDADRDLFKKLLTELVAETKTASAQIREIFAEIRLNKKDVFFDGKFLHEISRKISERRFDFNKHKLSKAYERIRDLEEDLEHARKKIRRLDNHHDGKRGRKDDDKEEKGKKHSRKKRKDDKKDKKDKKNRKEKENKKHRNKKNRKERDEKRD